MTQLNSLRMTPTPKSWSSLEYTWNIPSLVHPVIMSTTQMMESKKGRRARDFIYKHVLIGYTNREENKWERVSSRVEDGVKSACEEGKKVFLLRVASHAQPSWVFCHHELHNILYYLYVNTSCNSRNPVDLLLSIYPETHPIQITLSVRLCVVVAAHFSPVMM